MSETRRLLLDLLRRHPGGLSMKRAARLLAVPREEYRLFRRTVLLLHREGQLRRHRERFLLQEGERPARAWPRPASEAGLTRRKRPPGRSESRGQGLDFRPESVETERALGMAEIRREFELPADFGRDVLAECERVARGEPYSQADRLDLRSLPCVTIDPADARDHDDAISLEFLPGGETRLGVHIADVAEYVPEGGPLDREAFRRGNSTYFYLDTVPMLPPLLSGELCSLRRGQERATLSVLMDCDAAGRVARVKFAESVIVVADNLSYEEAQGALAGADPEEPGPMLRAMLKLAEGFRADRHKDGALDFDLPEIRPVDEGAGVVAFRPSAVLKSHHIVEEFMLAANHQVGYVLREHGCPRIFRVHESPDAEKVAELRFWLERQGVAWQPGAKADSRAFRDLAARLQARADRERFLVRMLRAMKKAGYTDRDCGHFGLAWRDYLHFTSPIRRYADLLVHRELKALIAAQAGSRSARPRWIERGSALPPRRAEARGEGRDFSFLFPRERRHRLKSLAEVARVVSDREVTSMEAERQGLRLEMTLWARQHLGESFAATILEIFPTGVLLRLPESGVEGFLPAQFLGREYFAYNEERDELRGERSNRCFAAGQTHRVRILGANLFSRRIQFSLEEDLQPYETI